MAHEHGKMDISEHEKTFHGFVKTGVYVSVIVAIVLIFLAIVGV